MVVRYIVVLRNWLYNVYVRTVQYNTAMYGFVKGGTVALCILQITIICNYCLPTMYLKRKGNYISSC